MGLANLATRLHALKRYEEALPKFEAALEMSERLRGGDHPDVAVHLSNLAGCLKSLGRAEEALPMFEARALDVRAPLSRRSSLRGDAPGQHRILLARPGAGGRRADDVRGRAGDAQATLQRTAPPAWRKTSTTWLHACSPWGAIKKRSQPTRRRMRSASSCTTRITPCRPRSSCTWPTVCSASGGPPRRCPTPSAR